MCGLPEQAAANCLKAPVVCAWWVDTGAPCFMMVVALTDIS